MPFSTCSSEELKKIMLDMIGMQDSTVIIILEYLDFDNLNTSIFAFHISHVTDDFMIKRFCRIIESRGIEMLPLVKPVLIFSNTIFDAFCLRYQKELRPSKFQILALSALLNPKQR